MPKSVLDTDIFSELLKGVGAVGVAGMAGAGWAHLDHPAPLRSRRRRRRRAAWRLALLWWTNRELIHHGAELGLCATSWRRSASQRKETLRCAEASSSCAGLSAM